MGDISVFRRIADSIFRTGHPLLVVFLIGLIIRLMLSPFALLYDAEFWALVIRNIEMGQGLYGVDGYYYTPIWGYLLGLSSVLQDMFLNIGEFAVKVGGFLPIEAMGIFPNSNVATVTTVAFLYSIKVPLFLFDAVTAFLVWYLVRDVTKDDRKAVAAFGIAFLSPVVLMSSGVIAMPDTISAMFSIMTVVLLRKDHPFIAGMTFSISVFTKFFPVFLIFILVAYVLMKDRDDVRKGLMGVVCAIAGFLLMSLILFMPQILEGNLAECFQFLTDRTGMSEDGTVLDAIMGIFRIATYVLILLTSLYVAYVAYRDRQSDSFEILMRGCLIVMAVSLLYPPNTQYIVSLIPYLAYWIVVKRDTMMKAWWLLAIGAILCAFSTNVSTLMPMVVSWGLFDVETMMEIAQVWYSNIWMISMKNVQFAIGGILQCAGIVAILLMLYYDKVLELLERLKRDKRHGNSH